MTDKFNYIIAAYFGKRRSYFDLENTDILLDIHLGFFQKHNIELLNRIIVIVNINDPYDIDRLNKIKNKYQNLPIDYHLIDNIGGSYYNYEVGVIKSLFLYPDIKYCFIFEDDYMPFDPLFYEPFLDKIKTNNNVYVCQMLDFIINRLSETSVIYPGISNGILDMMKIKDFYYKNNKIFDIRLIDKNNVDYEIFENNSVNFMNFLSQEYNYDGLCITFNNFLNQTKTSFNAKNSMGDFSHPHFFINVITKYGNIKGKVLIKPIIFNSYFFRELNFQDLDFLLSIRNECSELLHDNRKFTLDDAQKWYLETNPEFYIINYNNIDIGYFRVSNYSKENKSIYIGCDIHVDWRGKKLSYDAYINFMYLLFEKYEIENIYLEVLNINTVAYNLYKKIGFKEEKAKKLERNGDFLVSILMSIDKTSIFNSNFEFSFSDNKIHISCDNKIGSTFVCFYDEYDNFIRGFVTDFNFNSIWYSVLSLNRLNYVKIRLFDLTGNIINDGHVNPVESLIEIV